MSLPAGTVTLLLADVEGSVRLWEADRAATREAMKLLDELSATAIEAHGGVRPVEQGEGDNLVAAFERASDAVACAIAFQLAIERETWPGEMRPRFRVAIHTGEADLRDEGRYDGETMNRCARLRDTGHGGQILLSRTTHDLVAERLPPDVTVTSLGTHRLRDMARPEEIFQVSHPGLPATFPALRTPTGPSNNLPRQLTSFIGRETEIATVTEILTESRLVTLTGAGGCGKTRLGLQVAMQLLETYPDGVWWVDLARVSDPALVPSAVASALGVKEIPGRTVTESVRSYLAGRSTLLLVDNCEHLIDACAELADGTLRNCPNVSILATSREPLGVVGEVAWRVPSLVVPAESARSESLSQCEAVRLFTDRAVRVRPNFQLTDDNAGAVAQICSRLDGIPLAIELAAARTRMMTPEQIVHGLDDRFRLLTGSQRGVLPRHRTLEASVAWSYDLLGPRERTMLARLSVFRGSFTLDAAEDVCAGDGIERVEVLGLLSDLVDRSLVQVEEDTRTARYRLLETIRQYASDRLAESHDDSAVRTRHLDHYVALAERAAPPMMGPALTESLELLDREHANLRAAMDHGQRSGQREKVLRIAASMGFYWSIRGHLTEGRRRVEATIEAGDVDRLVRARALLAVARLGTLEYSPPWARASCEEALALAREAGDEQLIGQALGTLSVILGHTDPAAAPPVIDEAIETCTRTGDSGPLSSALFGRYMTQWASGDILNAGPTIEKAAALERASGHLYLSEIFLGATGLTFTYQGALAAAESAYIEALEIILDIGDHVFEIWCLAGLAAIATWRGDYEPAAAQLDGISHRARASGSPLVHVDLLARAQLGYARGELDSAVQHADKAVAIIRQTGLDFFIPVPLRTKIDALRLQGDLEAAEAAMQEALDAPSPGSGVWRGLALEAKGRLLRAQNELQQAEDVHHEALRMLMEGGAFGYAPDTLDSLGGLAGLAESDEEAARLFGAAEAQRERIGSVRFAVEQDGFDADVALVRERLSPEDFDRAWTEGRAMSLEEAASYAARGRGERKRPSSGWASLTPTETEVVKLVAEGLTNPQIAERLFVARATVKAHLSSIFRKLGVSTRSELATEATRRGG